MKKRFVAKGNKKKPILKIITFLSLIFISLVVTFNVLIKFSLNKTLQSSDIYNNMFDLATNETNIISLDLLNPEVMLKLGVNYFIEKEKTPIVDGVTLMNKHVNDPVPKVYIYNTHDTEAYNSSLLESYNIKYTVKIASYILSDYLQDLGVPTFVETASMSEFLSTSGLLYKDSYEASKYYIEKRLKEYPSIEYIIDLHRDSVPRSATTALIDGKSHVKVLFVVGLDYSGYENNLALAKKLSAKLPKEINRGVIEKTGEKVNGIYNQNLKDKALLLEIGGLENTIEEVDNTLKIVAGIIRDEVNGG